MATNQYLRSSSKSHPELKKISLSVWSQEDQAQVRARLKYKKYQRISKKHFDNHILIGPSLGDEKWSLSQEDQLVPQVSDAK